VFAGIRTSAVQIVATAALAGLVGVGGLGVIVSSGLEQSDDAIWRRATRSRSAALAELVFGGAERLRLGPADHPQTRHRIGGRFETTARRLTVACSAISRRWSCRGCLRQRRRFIECNPGGSAAARRLSAHR
jgi:hypothetical protein